MSRFCETFNRLRSEGRSALMPYMTAGDPGLEWTERLIDGVVEAGADMIELGVPYSDPLADGPTVQAAGQRALKAGTTIDGIFQLVRRVRSRHDLPIGLLVYYNCIFRRGEERFIQEAADSGIDGVIVPDLPLESAESLERCAQEKGVDVIYLVAPTTPDERLRLIGQRAQGFLYCVSLTGVTGARQSLSQELSTFLGRVRAGLEAVGKNTPLAVGFGISSPEQAANVGAMADGVIVGSALIDRCHGAPSPQEGVEAGAAFIKQLRAALNPMPRSL